MGESWRNDIQLHVTSDDGVVLPATLSLPPSAPLRGGVVPLHPAAESSREQFLFQHLADLLPRHGIAVLRYDRRSTADGGDVPLTLQAQDALAALQTLRYQAGSAIDQGETLPVGLWGFSQGAWAAPFAASLSSEVAWLALVASTGVSPARQMRYGTAEQLRRTGFDQEALAELALLRSTCEDYLLDESIDAWRCAADVAGNQDVTVVRLPGTRHHPTLHGGREVSTISPLYTETLLTWLSSRVNK